MSEEIEGEISSSLWSSSAEGEEEQDEEQSLELEGGEEWDDPLIDMDEEDIDMLIEKVKRFTTLSDLGSEDWTEEAEDIIRQFVLYPKNDILSAYFQDGKLEVMLGIPKLAVSDIMCFTKDTSVKLTPENFHEVIQFVTCCGTVETSVLSVMQYVFTPALLKSRSLPEGTRSEFLTKMYSFLSDYTDIKSKLQGYTAIFVPTETRKYSPSEGSENKELVKQLEGMLVIWTRQIRVALGDVVITGLKDDRYPIDEYNFWVYRYQVLCALDYQLKNKDLRHIVAILSAAQSTFVIQFFGLQEEIKEAIEIAKSNIEYLQILMDPCNALSKVRNPLDIPKSLPYIIYLCHVIWKHSPHYNTKEHMSGLFRNLSNLVMLQCKKSVAMTDILKGNAGAGLKQHQACIQCLEKYKAYYDKITEALAEHFHELKELDKGLIFNHVDSFIQRCREMIEICEAMLVFGRMNESEEVAKPIFGGTHGPEFQRTFEKVEHNFRETLRKVKEVQDAILDVQNPAWLDVILFFRNEVKDMEVVIENMITSLFKKVTNLEEGLQDLQAIYHYSKRPALTAVYERSVEIVYKIFGEDVQDVKKDILDEKFSHPAGMPYYSGKAMVALLKKNRLNRLYDLIEGAKWLPQCAVANEVLRQYRKVDKAAEDIVRDLYNKWVDSMTEDIAIRLERPLMCRSQVQQGLLEPNIDRKLLPIEEEARYWKLMKFGVPRNVGRMMAKLREVNTLYESVLSVCMDYNRIITALAPDERFLFRELIRVCNKKIQPGLSKLMWSTDVSDVYIGDCLSHTTELQEFVDDFKDSNVQIARICEKICDSPMVAIDVTESYTVKMIQDIFDVTREKVLEEIIGHVQDILNCLVLVYEGFEEHIATMKTQWTEYIMRMDSMLEEALAICIRGSLSVLLEALHGDGTAGPNPIINIDVTLAGNRIAFEPTLIIIADLVTSVLPNCVNCLQAIPRIHEKFHIPSDGRQPYFKVLHEDEECRNLQSLLVKELEFMVQQVQLYLKLWEPFRDIWEVNKDMFISRYEKLKPSVASFDSDISRYTEVANNVRMQESITFVHFLIINANSLKDVIADHCLQWQNKLFDLLSRLFANKLNDHYAYVAEYSYKSTVEPQTLNELQDTISLHKRLLEEIPIQEKEFPIIQDQHNVLTKYEIEIPKDLLQKLKNLMPNWQKYLELLDAMFLMIEKSKERFRYNLLDNAEVFKKSAKSLLEDFHKTGPFTSDWNTDDALAKIKEFKDMIKAFRGHEDELRSHLAIFGISLPDNSDLAALERDLEALEVVWTLRKQWDDAWEKFKYNAFLTLEAEEMEDTAQTLFRKLTRLAAQLEDKGWSIVEDTRRIVDEFRRTLPLISDLKNPAMRSRHWNQVKQLVGEDFDEHSDDFTLDAIIRMDFQAYAEQINEISNAATMEMQIEEGLANIKAFWDVAKVELSSYKDLYRIKIDEDIFQALDEHQTALAAMKTTRFVDPFIKDVDYWERTLSTIMETMEMTLHVQRIWLYLENIFIGEDIRRQLPKETDAFDKVSEVWTDLTCQMNEVVSTLKIALIPDLLLLLNKLNEGLEGIQRGLEKYLETKRHIFPRFYFISNDDLLEVLAQSKRPDLVQPHLKKCFDNLTKINIVKPSAIAKSECVGMYSAEGEYIPFGQSILLAGPVEWWLVELESKMRITLRDTLKLCKNDLRKNLSKRDKWIQEWPGQTCITASQIQWTSDCVRALTHCKVLESRTPMKRVRKKLNNVLNKFSEAIRGSLSKLQRLKIVALVTIEIHARDTVDKMYKSNCRDVTAFEWLSQLRFFWDRDIDDCIIRQTNTYFTYGYEYLGNSGRLVITPLTDRCYITLTTALHLHRGGSPKGPAGTGKTETVKDLGKSLGSYVIVLNCSEGLDYKSMGRCFSGLSQTGAWGCFDEFNRINIEVLSVVAQQIMSILGALSVSAKKFIFEGSEISLVLTCGIFITMNPGYAGRTELPDNLKSMFRPISMMVPDTALIAEIILFGEGFGNTRVLAKKVDTLYNLAKQQLSKQDHYDFGLRALVSLIRYAGNKRRAHPMFADEVIVLIAMKDMNIAKLTSGDVPLFSGITSDLFPGVETPAIEYEELTAAVQNAMRKSGLQPLKLSIVKVIQLFETKNSRHSTMIVGKSGSGKSATWKTLQSAMSALSSEGKEDFKVVRVYPMNPKAVTLAELYGEFDLATGEWKDGVLSNIMRSTCSDESPDEKWILFDGPVDAVWIENMNSVMDDNKVLTLINSERITMPPQVSLLFEVEDLAVASPATVSRCGMVYNDYKDLGWQPYVTSWLKTVQPDIAKLLKNYFELYIGPLVEFKRKNCGEPVPILEINMVMGLCKLLFCLLVPEHGVNLKDRDNLELMVKMWFIFSMVWAIGGTVDDAGREILDNYIRSMESIFPLKDTVYEYVVDHKSKVFISWEERLSESWKLDKELPFFKLVVPTVDTARYKFLVSSLLMLRYPCLLMGPVGTGKTSNIMAVVDTLDTNRYAILTINMSAQTTAANVQDIIESRVEKRTKNMYAPPGDKKMVTFFDDLNMPVKEQFGAQPPLELLRQWIDYEFWYDREKQLRKYVKDMILVAAMGPPGGGRNFISDRLMTCFNIINMTFPTENQITRIFGTMLTQQLADFESEARYIGPKITEATIELYNMVCQHMLPTPAKIHYLFNLRDISKIFQGLLRSNKKQQYNKDLLLRLWVHECFRVFNDRLTEQKDMDWFLNKIGNQLGTHFETTFNGVCPEKECPVFVHFMNPFDIYEDITDMAALRNHLEAQMVEYNQSPGVVHLDLVLFKDAILHICRIVRVISQPRGNMLVIGMGGSGRQSLSRIASYLSELRIFTVEVTKTYRVIEFKDDLKELYSKAGIENRAMAFIFSDTQVTEEAFMEIVNNMLSSGEVPNLYKTEEFEDVKNKIMNAATKAGVLQTSEALLSFFIERVRTNLHILLAMSPVGDAFRDRIRQYPALVNCTTIDWFHDWPREALLEVGFKWLNDINFLAEINETQEQLEEKEVRVEYQDNQKKIRSSVASIFAAIHHSVGKCSKQMMLTMKRHNYVTPINYLELVIGYKEMLEDKRASVKLAADKLRNGLFKIDETRSKVEVMSVELKDAQVKVAEFQQQCDDYLVVITDQKRVADETQREVATNKVKIQEEEVICKKLAAVAQADLDQAMPALEEAMKALDALNKRDLTEVKSYGRPPPKVAMVMEAVMILKGSEPTWSEAKKQLGDVNFLNQLREFDKDNVSDKTLKKIAVYTANPEFQPEKVGVVSLACKSLCIWVRAIENYAKIYKVVKPKKEKLEEATEQLRIKQELLAEAEQKLKELSEELARLEKEYAEKMRQKEELRKKAEILMQKLERAMALVSGLSGERSRWEATIKNYEAEFLVLPGNCLLAVAFLSYAGPFVTTYRDKLMEVWKAEIKQEQVPMSDDFSASKFLTDATTIREWNIQGLPSDDFSTENGIIVTRCTRWPLLIDPQCQGMKWVKNMEGGNELSVIDCGQVDFMKVLENAIQFGKPVLLQNVLEALDPSLTPILNKAIVKQGGQDLIKLSDKFVQYNYNFRFFITTKLGNPHYPPEICTKTTLVNFAVKEQGLEAQLLGIVVRKEMPQLEELKEKLVLNIAAGRRTLMELEDQLLRLLYEAKGSLLDDLELLITLQTSQSTSVTVTKQLKESETTEVEIDQAREGYRPCARRASILFFVLMDMSVIDPMYQFSLDVYISLFVLSIEKSKKAEELEERIAILNTFHTYSVYKNTCRGLFERHKLLFSFHMTIKILEALNKVNKAEYMFLLKGGVVLDRTDQIDNPSPGWLSDIAWDNITELDKIAGFHGVVDTFEHNPQEWHVWYTDKQPEELPLIGDWEDICTEFQKMLFVRSLRPDRMSFCVTSFVVSNLGQPFVEPPVLDIKSVLEDSNCKTPLIFVLSPGVDPTGKLLQLAETVGMSEMFQSLSLGQGQAPIATKLIKRGAKEGLWVFLANCHLSLSWMPRLDKIVELIGSSKINPAFRLWLSSSPHPDFPISILQAGIKMTTEPPKGIRANLKRLYNLITDERFVACQQHNKYSRLLFSLCFFHSILLERKKFQELGWNVVYSFNDSDFEVSENLLTIYLDEYEVTPWDALKYLIAGINYGGHVTDDWDRRLLLTYINQYFTEEVLSQNMYRLSSLPSYYIPRDGSLESYVDFIAMLPQNDLPEAFGQHSNADITSLISETKSLFETMLSMQSETQASQAESREVKVFQLTADVLDKIPKPIDYEQTEKLIGPHKTPLDVVLLQEITRYNALLVSMRESLLNLQKGIKGLVVMSSELEDIFTCFFEGRVPEEWLKTYPSLKLLGSWTRDLVSRVEHFGQWAATTHAPTLFWLSAYTFPTGLLTAVLQTSARKSQISIDLLSWDFKIFQLDERVVLTKPDDGIYVRGTFLEGAGWDKKTMSLCEPQPMELVCSMPIIHFKPVENLKKKTKGIYVSPCYYYPIRSGAGNRPSFVVAVDLKCGKEGSDHWVKRGTALLLSLAN